MRARVMDHQVKPERDEAGPRETPPEPPEIPRRVQLRTHQWVVLPLLFLIPVLALFGVFGHSEAEAKAGANGADGPGVRVRYPSRTRHMIPSSVEIEVTNGADRPAAKNVRVHVSRAYVDAFSEASLTPEPDAITDREYRVPLGDLAPGETRTVTMDGRARSIGGQRGTVSVSADGGAPSGGSGVELSTFVFP